jgi:acetylornithine deacetylase
VEHSNALLAAARDLAGFPACLELDGKHPLLGASTVAATVLRAGERHNVVPDSAEAVLDARLAPPHAAGDAAAAIARYLKAAEIAVRSARLSAVETAEEHPLVQAALRAAGHARAVGSTTLSDMALLPGVPAVKCGPGATARSHTADEYVELAEVEAGARFYLRFAPAALAALRAQEALK